MQIYFAGAEVPSHLSVLRDCGVERVAVNIANLARQSVKPRHLGHQEALGRPGVGALCRQPECPCRPRLGTARRTAKCSPRSSPARSTGTRTTWLANSDLLFLPIWDATDPTILRDYTENYDGVTLPDAVVDNPTAVRQARASINRLGQLAAITGRTKGLERFDTLVSSAWWAVQKYGETQVWAANRLVRLNSDDKRLKRERYAPAIEALGCDPAKLLEDDPDRVGQAAPSCRGCPWSGTSSGAPVHTQSEVAISGYRRSPTNVVPIAPGVARPAPRPRHHLLPVMRTQDTTVRLCRRRRQRDRGAPPDHLSDTGEPATVQHLLARRGLPELHARLGL